VDRVEECEAALSQSRGCERFRRRAGYARCGRHAVVCSTRSSRPLSPVCGTLARDDRFGHYPIVVLPQVHDLSFRGRDNAERLGDVVKFHWEAVAKDGELFGVGLNFLVLAADGRIERDYTFVVA
jgi:hypothetical protein